MRMRSCAELPRKDFPLEPVLDAVRSSHSLISSDMEAMKQELKDHAVECARSLENILVCTEPVVVLSHHLFD